MIRMIDVHSHCYLQEFVNKVLSLGPPFAVGTDAKKSIRFSSKMHQDSTAYRSEGSHKHH
jgi:hypothetical protein